MLMRLLGLTLLITLSIPSGLARAEPQALQGKNKAIGKATNTSRTKAHMPTLKSSSCLQKYAQGQAERMANRGTLYHQDLKKVLRACKLRRVGENVAYGFTGVPALQRAWMGSSGHRRNILTRKFNRMGIASVKTRTDMYYVVVFGQK